MNQITSFRLCKLTDDELLQKVDKGFDEIYQTGKIPARHIPARPDSDLDLLVGELLLRFKERATPKGEATPAPGQKEPFILRQIDTNKWYWCKCENCGWEDSSEFCDGGAAIADTGDHTDPTCPVCGCNKLEGEPELKEPDSYTGIQYVKIPLDAIINPMKKTIAQQQNTIQEFRWTMPATPPAGAAVTEGIAAKILSQQFETYSPLRQQVVSVDDIKRIFKDAGIEVKEDEPGF